MAKTPFGGSNGGLQPTTSLLGQISQNKTTTPDTKGIGTLSLDLSGQPKNNPSTQRAEGLGAVPGVVADAVVGGVGAVLGGLATLAQSPQNLVYGELRKGAVKRYMGEDPGPLSDGLTAISRLAQPYATKEGYAEFQKFEKNLRAAIPLPDPLKEIVAAPVQGALQVGATAFNTLLGVGLSRQKQVGAVGGFLFGPQLISNDPETLSTEVKSILDNGGTMEDALNHMKDNYQWVGDDALVNFLTGVTMDPLNWAGYPITFSSKIGASQELAAVANDGRTWQEFLAASTMTKGEIAVAKRMGFLGKTYNSSIGPAWDRVKTWARASVVDATMHVVGVKAIDEADLLAKEIGGNAPTILANNLNRSLNFMIVDATRSPLTRNAANGANEWAQSVIATAGEGADALRAMPEFRGASDEIVNKVVSEARAYMDDPSDLAKEALNNTLDELRRSRNIKLINDEVGGFFMKGARRIPFVGKYYREETIYAARRALYRSLQRHETEVARAFETGDEAVKASIKSKYVSKMSSSLNAAENGNVAAIERYFDKVWSRSQSLWAAGKKEDAILDMARTLEVAQMSGFAQAVKIVQPLRKLTGQKITPVLSNRFSRETLQESMEFLTKAMDTGDKDVVSKAVNELVIKYQDLATKFDSVNLAANLSTDADKIAKDVMFFMRKLWNEEAYVSRLPEGIISKMDEFEFGIEPATRAVGSVAMQSGPLWSIYSSAKYQVGRLASRIGDIREYLNGEITRDYLIDRVTAGHDINGWNNFNLATTQDAGATVMRGGDEAARRMDELASQWSSQYGDKFYGAVQPSTNPSMLRKVSEAMHNGIKTMVHSETPTNNAFKSQGAMHIRDGSEAVIQNDGLVALAPGVSDEFSQFPQISNIITDPTWASRLSSEVPGYDGLYGFGVTPTNSTPVSEVAIWRSSSGTGSNTADLIHEFIYHKMLRSATRSGGYDGAWRSPDVIYEKQNAFRAAQKSIMPSIEAMVGSAMDETFVGATQSVPLMHNKNRIFGATEEGFAEVMALPFDEKAKLYLDPFRLIVGFLTENAPIRTVPDLDKTIVSFRDTDGSIAQAFDLVRNKGFNQVDAYANTPFETWLGSYLSTNVFETSAGQRRIIDLFGSSPEGAPDLSRVAMKEYTPEELDMLKKTGIDNPKTMPDVTLTVQKLLAEGSQFLDQLKLAAQKIDETRSVYYKEGQVQDASREAWKIMAPMSGPNKSKFAFADWFHGLDGTNGSINTTGESFYQNKELGSKVDFSVNLFERYGEFDPAGLRLFDFLERRTMAPTSALSAIVNNKNAKVTTGTLARLKWLSDAKASTMEELIEAARVKVTDGELTFQEAYSDLAKAALSADEFVSPDIYKASKMYQGMMHRFVENLGSFTEARLGQAITLGEKGYNPSKSSTFLRVYDPSGSVLLEPRYVKTNKEGMTLGKIMLSGEGATQEFIDKFSHPEGIYFNTLRLAALGSEDVLTAGSAQRAAKVANAADLEVDSFQPKTPEEAAQVLEETAAFGADGAKKTAIEELVKARAQLREIGYEMGLEPKQPYIQSLDVMRDVAGNAVIRPRFDIYTSIDEVEDLSSFGMKNADQLPLRGRSLMDRYRKMVIPISNNEIYDSGVERLRYYLGNRLSNEDSLRAMANIAEEAMRMEVNPGGMSNERLAEIFIDVFGGGERGLRSYNRVFGVGGANASPRAALMYALQGRPETIGWTTNISKRLQAKSDTMAMIAQKIYPLTRYRYNPYFNWQEGIEPYAFSLLRGVRGEKDFEDGSMMAQMLSSKGGAMLDAHNVGAHVMMRNASVLQRLAQQNPAIDIAVGERVVDRLIRSGKEGAEVLGGASEKFRQSVSDAKEANIAASTLNEAIREVAPSVIKDQPEVGLNWVELTGSLDPATNFGYYIDANVNGMLPTQIVRLADVASSRYAYGSHIEPTFLQPFKDIASLQNPKQADIDALEDISALLEKVGGPIEARKKVALAARKFLASVKKSISNGAVEIKTGQYFQGQKSATSVDNITNDILRAIQKYTGSIYDDVNSYLGKKGAYGVQRKKWQGDLEELVDNTEFAMYSGAKNKFEEIDAFVNLIDQGIQQNRILSRGRIYRGAKLTSFLNDADLPLIKPGFRFGTENIGSWSKIEKVARTAPNVSGTKAPKVLMIIDDARGMPGLDINALRNASGVVGEEEILLPRGMEFEVIEDFGMDGGFRMLKVKPIFQPQSVEALTRLHPSDAARIELQNAISDIEIQQAKNIESYQDLARFFAAYPDVLEGVQEMGMRLKQAPADIPNVRYRRKKPSVNAGKVEDFDPSKMHDRYSSMQTGYEPPIQGSVLAPEFVFGTRVQGPLASLNTGGRTGVWMGSDGIKRYVKTVDMAESGVDRHAIVNEYIVNRLLKKMGVSVPETSLVVDGEDIYLASVWVDGMKDLQNVPITQEIAKAMADNHVADLIMANFDAVGPDLRNMGILPDGTLVRTDVGNSLFYRAGGQIKAKTIEGKKVPAKSAFQQVDPTAWFDPTKSKAGSGLDAYKNMLTKAYPELEQARTTLEIPNFVEQYTDMITRLGNVDAAIDDIVNEIVGSIGEVRYYDNVNPIFAEAFGKSQDFASRISATKDLLKSRIAQVDASVGQIRASRLAEYEDKFGALGRQSGASRARRPKVKKQDKWILDISERLAAAQAEGVRLPGLDEAVAIVKAGGSLSPDQVRALSNGIAPFLYKRGAMKQFMDSIAQIHARALKRVFKEQMYSTHKGQLERTFNHPFAGPYPTSYMYGKVLPAFIDHLFVYAPFTGEFAPFMGFRRLNQFQDYIATELETNDAVYEYVMKRPPLLMFLSGLLPGWPTDIGASLPYWFREGVMRPVAEGNFENIPGALGGAVKTTLERQFGPAQTVGRTIDAVTDIQSFLTGDPNTSVIDDISEFLSIKDSN